jgi:hypothetical protein
MLAVVLTPALITSPQQRLAALEQLVPQIERARVLTPETKDAMLQLIDRVRSAPPDRRLEARRDIAIDRMTAAIKSRDVATELSSVGRRLD